jgi:hypothetical protein
MAFAPSVYSVPDKWVRGTRVQVELALTAYCRTRHCIRICLAGESPGAFVGQVSSNSANAERVSECMLRSKEQVSNSLKFMDKLLAKEVSKGKIQEIEAKEARDRMIVLDYDTQGIQGFRDTDMVIEVISSVPVHVCYLSDNLRRLPQRTCN